MGLNNSTQVFCNLFSSRSCRAARHLPSIQCLILGVDKNYFVSKMSEAEIKVYLLEARQDKNRFE